MNFVNTLAPWQWVVLGLVPPAIILLYFLKLKRQPLVVPSTYLWRRTLEDLHVNSLWQRLRSNLLLLLQLLIIFLLMGALLRPGRRGPQLLGHRFIFLIDVSASSQATDVSPSRLEAAKRQVADMIDQMESGDSAMVVQFSDRAEIVQNYTQQKRPLKERVRALRPTARGSSLREALRVASGLANPSSARGEGAEQS
ncbi:MAG TPA: VWA domain-containing protein, partial [Planctomycetaceae bacterium]|nr:VWA domain-containing protein [Planctomycetaceae bacterium]